ncbi:DoxX family protein [Massilia antarctica]|uniref:DoxX family protein n=1 Tax=Massilia antarctica TaxID=2765360 RepID=UPI0006BB8162|nr:DoxX family protein [Massilia sp. H27-R4]MCY0911825.1 DoxX family protein [Massilia sp. H27-R4]CUI06718.1 putative membrane protein [Janthinobacterium sp. CG23_2]CUU30504.1 putative membrane protein [Janthinobacterium sp. CG23_2]
MNTTTHNTSVIPVIGRVLLAAIFIFSGIGKIMAPGATIGYMEAMGMPLASVGLVIAIVVELVGGLMLAVGFKIRLVALGLALFSIVTGLVFHHAIGDQNQLIHLLKNLAMAGGLLQVVAFGAGAYSLESKAAGTTGRQLA